MMRVKIFGAGSIGNHLAHASRSLGWDVSVVDINQEALDRTRRDIYPSRYGAWDENIKLYDSKSAPKGGFDLVIVGTPPDSHLPLAQQALSENPKGILIEKPLCTPDLKLASDLFEESKRSTTKLFVGYDHSISRGINKLSEMLSSGVIGDVKTIDVEFREHWGGIFKAHPWLAGPQDSYLGYWKLGGGASGEHSHAMHLWQHLALVQGFGKIIDVDARVEYAKAGKAEFDTLCLLNVKTEKSLVGRIVQDVVTTPSKKIAKVQGENGALTWVCSYNNDGDALLLELPGEETQIELITKTRPDDFIEELKQIEFRIQGSEESCGIDWERGLETMLVIAAAHLSEQKGERVTIDYDQGYTLDALS